MFYYIYYIILSFTVCCYALFHKGVGVILILFHKVNLAPPCHHAEWIGHSDKVWGHSHNVWGSLSQCEGITFTTLDYITLRCVVSCYIILSSYADLCSTVLYFAKGGGSVPIYFKNTDVASIIFAYNAPIHYNIRYFIYMLRCYTLLCYPFFHEDGVAPHFCPECGYVTNSH